MIEDIHRIREEARTKISSAGDLSELDRLRVEYLGKKGHVTSLLKQLKDLSPEARRTVGAEVNQTKSALESEFEVRRLDIQRRHIEQELTRSEPLDVTLPGHYAIKPGSAHPVTRVLEEMVSCLGRIGFTVATGPEIELDYYNFEALNMPETHPARDMHDTFYVGGPLVLRTHTSPVQIRVMKKKQPPLQVIAFGRVYRSDHDMTHSPMFHQMEGFMVDDGISLADLKGVLQHLVNQLFGNRPLRFRPSFFPFTEPSAEVDMQCVACKGKGATCRVCGSSGWLEIGGCGMIHPNVFLAAGHDPEKHTGFAFGMGIERIAMLKYGVTDIRSFYENDCRMLEQF